MNKHNKAFRFEVKSIGAEDDRTLRFIGSTETPDRDGDVISADGWELQNYMMNPVFLWAHDHSIPPIGKAIRVWVENKKLMFDIQFPTSDIYPFADTIYKLYKNGYLTATSVGFVGKSAIERDDEAVKDAPSWQVGVKFTRQELLELSAVPVPSNPTALQTAKAKGYITATEQKYFEDATAIEIDVELDNEIEIEFDPKHIETDCTSEEVAKMVGQAVSKAIGK